MYVFIESIQLVFIQWMIMLVIHLVNDCIVWCSLGNYDVMGMYSLSLEISSQLYNGMNVMTHVMGPLTVPYLKILYLFGEWKY